ncbi:MAG: DUF4968 domain-containing protein, partial [Cyclobacteriaceae bacterium]|nr:DUF4968 domain-containing protein [Cyclobacteriaceae bacterium]
MRQNQMHRLILSIILVIYFSGLSAQILDVTPDNPTTSSDVVIIYNATLGNAELSGYSGDVYAHTGLITTESQNGSDWKHVVGNWGQADPQVLMERIDDDLYRISYNIETFYGVNPDEETVLELAFVFRNEDGSLVGRSENQSDIFYTINIGSSGDYVSYTHNEDGLSVITTKGELIIEPYTPEIIRLAFTPEFTNPNDTSYSVILESQQPAFTVENNDGYLLLTTDALEIKIEKSPIRTLFYKNGNLITSEELGFYNQAGRQGIRLSLEGEEQLSGTGSRAIPVNRRGYRLPNYGQAHYGYGNGAENLNISIPFVASSRGYALFFDNHSAGTFDLGSLNTEVLDFASESGNMIYYFI